MSDAPPIRSRLLLTFEQAERTSVLADRQRLLNTAIIGRGLTGVWLPDLFPNCPASPLHATSAASTRIMLVQAGPRQLIEFPKELSFWATAQQKQLGVETLIGHAVEDIQTDSISSAKHLVA